MTRFDYFLIVCTLLLLVGNCATPRVVPSATTVGPVVADRSVQPSGDVLVKLKQAERLYTIANSILLANADLCGENVAPWYGFYGGDIYLYEGDWRESLKAAYSLGEEPMILADVVVSPLYQAGLRRGDVIKGVNGAPTRTGRNATAHLLAMLGEASRGGLVELEFKRNEKRQAVRVPTKFRCNYNVIFEDSEKLNSYSDRRNIVLSSAMIKFASRDEELALVIAHEVAHNTIKRSESGLVESDIGGLLGDAYFAVSTMFSGESSGRRAWEAARALGLKDEQDADYVTMYLLARAGVRTKPELANFWDRVAGAGLGAIDRRFGHPNFPERQGTIQNAILEINSKRSSGEPLMPEQVDR